MRSRLLIILAVSCLAISCTRNHPPPPAPYGAVPSPAQQQWHEMEFYGFIHFGLNTFTDQEWGYGDTDPSRFNPTDFDAGQIASAAREAGMTGLILTCKHHDGFCLWPSAYTDYSVKSSPWKEGQGDVVKEMSEACAANGLKFGVYLSPWDRHHPDYGKPAYNDYYRNQLRELLTNYGPVFEVWFDGANGGTGWYGGADEERKIDPATYYDWKNTWKIVRELQADAVIFSDAGPDIRWVGNEEGGAGDPCWATYTPRGREGRAAAPGWTEYRRGEEGDRDGLFWMPAECDVSIRPGWFYHASQDSLVRTSENLFHLYLMSVGRGASLLLNLPPDRRGRIPDQDIDALKGFRELREEAFGEDLAQKATVTASNTRCNARFFSPRNVTDQNKDSYWTTDDGAPDPELVLDFGEPVRFNIVRMEEYLQLGQRISRWSLDRWDTGDWVTFAGGTSIGHSRIWTGEPVTTSKLRIRFPAPDAAPAIRCVAIVNQSAVDILSKQDGQLP